MSDSLSKMAGIPELNFPDSGATATSLSQLPQAGLVVERRCSVFFPPCSLTLSFPGP